MNSNSKVQKIECDLPEGQTRIESGFVQFNDDWSGLFIRGDNAMYLNLCWELLKNSLPEKLKEELTLQINYLDSFLTFK